MAGWIRDSGKVAGVVGAVAATALLGVVAARTAHRWDVTLKLAGTLLPVEAALVAVALMRGAAFEAGDGRAVVGLLALLVVAPANLVLAANQYGDRSAARIERLPVIDKETVRHRRSTSYRLRIDPGLPRPMASFTLYGGGEEVAVDRATFDAAVPGRSRLALALHPGLFGYPWWEADPRLEP